MSPDHGRDLCLIFVYLLSAAAEGPGCVIGLLLSRTVVIFRTNRKTPTIQAGVVFTTACCAVWNGCKSILNFTGMRAPRRSREIPKHLRIQRFKEAHNYVAGLLDSLSGLGFRTVNIQKDVGRSFSWCVTLTSDLRDLTGFGIHILLLQGVLRFCFCSHFYVFFTHARWWSCDRMARVVNSSRARWFFSFIKQFPEPNKNKPSTEAVQQEQTVCHLSLWLCFRAFRDGLPSFGVQLETFMSN